MEEYRLAREYLNKNKNNNNNNNKISNNTKKILISFLNRTLLSILLLVVALCLTKLNTSYKTFIEKNIYTNNISFSKINNMYESVFGKIYPIEKIESSKVEPVFNENLAYKNIEQYKEGVKLVVDSNYLVPVLESGLVVYKGNKDNYGYTIIIQQVNGIDLWYVGLKNSDLKLYEYVEKGGLLGEVNGNELYLYYQKDGNFIDYKEYLG